MNPPGFSRETARSWIEEATGHGLSVADPLPDTLTAAAEAAGLQPHDLRMWIFESPHPSWSARSLMSWASRYQLADAVPAIGEEPARCGHCAEQVSEAANHQCTVATVRPISVYIDLPAIRPDKRAAIMQLVSQLLNAIAAAGGDEDAGASEGSPR